MSKHASDVQVRQKWILLILIVARCDPRVHTRGLRNLLCWFHPGILSRCVLRRCFHQRLNMSGKCRITKPAPLAQASRIGTIAKPSSTEACQRGSGRPLNIASASVYLTDYHVVRAESCGKFLTIPLRLPPSPRVKMCHPEL